MHSDRRCRPRDDNDDARRHDADEDDADEDTSDHHHRHDTVGAAGGRELPRSRAPGRTSEPAARPESPRSTERCTALNADDPGVLFAGGSFTSAGGNPKAAHLAKWNGSAWSAVGPTLNGDVHAIAYKAGKVFVGGVFTNAGGDQNLDFVARWNGVKWGPVCNSQGPLITANVNALQIIGSTLYIGGSFANGAGIAVEPTSSSPAT